MKESDLDVDKVMGYRLLILDWEEPDFLYTKSKMNCNPQKKEYVWNDYHTGLV